LKGEHSRLLQTFINYQHKKVLTFGPGGSNIASITVGLKGEHSRLLQAFINYGQKKVLTFGPGGSNIASITLASKANTLAYYNIGTLCT
jgi:hypothetical protein